MTLSQRLDLRGSQSLVMTPQLQQAIKLLQMSNQELCDFVASEIENNPFLEREEDTVSTQSVAEHAAERGLLPLGADDRLPSSDTGGNDVTVYEAYGPEAYDGGSARGNGDYDPAAGRSLAETVAERPSLRDHVLSQIHIDFADPSTRVAAVALVDLLDEAGYLPADLDVARSQLGVPPDIFESLIQQLQRLDPPGLFARSLKECLSIQLREKNRLDPAMATLLDHLDLLAKREKTQLMKICGVDAEDLADMIVEIKALNPKPAMAFTSDASAVLAPDVLLVPLPGGGWHIELNNENLPRVLVNESFYARLQGGGHKGADKTYLTDRWQQANWLTKALRQRATTILKVATEIVKKQDAFFVHGVQYLKPLILRDIAEAVEMHESTVSRVTQNKTIATPRGMFELKYFFTNALPTTGGATMVSTIAVRERIKALIDAEAPRAVLSDDRIMELLRQEGIDIARRTIAKYREAMHIPTSSQRRRDKRDG